MAVTNLKRYLKPLALNTFRKKSVFFLSLSVGFSALMFAFALFNLSNIPTTQGKILGTKTKKQIAVVHNYKRPTITPTISIKITPTVTVTLTVTQKLSPTPAPTNTPQPEQKPAQISSPDSQYTAEKISDTTFRIKNVQNDNSMASSQEIFDALNTYRQSRGAGIISWSNSLAELAQSRVSTFASRGDLDSHAGFRDFMNNDGFSKAGFNGLGENSARLSGPMSGERIIREIFGADAPHDINQLNPEWTHGAVAISGNFVNVNFGKGKR